MSGYSKVLVVASMTALSDALLKYPDARVVTSNATERIDLPLRPEDYIAHAPSDAPPSRGPQPRRKYPVRR